MSLLFSMVEYLIKGISNELSRVLTGFEHIKVKDLLNAFVVQGYKKTTV